MNAKEIENMAIRSLKELFGAENLADMSAERREQYEHYSAMFSDGSFTNAIMSCVNGTIDIARKHHEMGFDTYSRFYSVSMGFENTWRVSGDDDEIDFECPYPSWADDIEDFMHIGPARLQAVVGATFELLVHEAAKNAFGDSVNVSRTSENISISWIG